MTLAVLDDLIDTEVFEPSALGELLAVAGLANAWGTSDDDIWCGA